MFLVIRPFFEVVTFFISRQVYAMDFKSEIANLIFYPVESIGFDDFIIYYRFLCKQFR